MESARSLQTRAVLALLLMVGFYALAIIVAVALLVVPVALAVYGNLMFAKLVLVSVPAGAAILYAIAPRIDKFVPPGPQLMPEDAPRLFQIIEEVAAATAQQVPEEVYLLPDANAFVGQRGGLIGIGSRRVMGIGLPLIGTLSTSELRAVIAHEFGHYVSGDVALGPWIYKTRNAIVRSVVGVGETELLRDIFLAYLQMYLRMTMQISREQEFVADATAARIAGAGATRSALRRMDVVIPAYTTYVRQELIPILHTGYLPPHLEGFTRYLNAPKMYAAFEDFARKLAAQPHDLYDSHPPTAERIAAIKGVDAPIEAVSGEPASTLLNDPVALDRAVLQFTVGQDNFVKLRPIAWEQFGATAFPQILADRVNEWAWWLRSQSAEKIPSDRGWFVRSGHDMLGRLGPAAPDDDYRKNLCVQTLSYAVALLLLRAGWTVVTAPGEAIVMVKDGVRFTCVDAIESLADGSMPVDAWRAKCSELGIAGAPLSSAPLPRK